MRATTPREQADAARRGRSDRLAEEGAATEDLDKPELVPQPEPEHEPESEHEPRSKQLCAEQSALALPLVLARGGAACRGGWFSDQVAAASVCRAWRRTVSSEESCSELALARSSEDARRLHAQAGSEQPRPWRWACRQLRRGEAAWQRGPGFSDLIYSEPGKSLLHLAHSSAAEGDEEATLLATSCFDGCVRAYCLREGGGGAPSCVPQAELVHGAGPVDACSVHSDGDAGLVIASGSREQTVKLWRLPLPLPNGADSEQVERQLAETHSAKPAVEWAGLGGRVMAVDTTTCGGFCAAGLQFATLPRPFTSDRHRQGSAPTAASPKPLRVWDVQTSEELRLPLPRKPQRHSVACVRCFDEGRTIVASNIRGHCFLYDCKRGSPSHFARKRWLADPRASGVRQAAPRRLRRRS